jgi:carbonic anhydrase/acetyltransferase-like protein (isoleucine patch superfamily)
MSELTYQEKLAAQVVKGKEVFIADTARVLGQITLEDNVSIWFGAVLRGDNDKITVGARTNIQENCIFHVDHGKPITIGTDNVIGHGAIIHGATIGNFNLIGMGATILNGAVIGDGCIIGAHALVTEKMVVTDGSMVLGSPGKITKTLPVEFVKQGVKLGVDEYMHEGKKYLGVS